MFRLFTPSTPVATSCSAFAKIDGGSTSSGPLGFLLIDVKSPQAVIAASAATTLRILYRIWSLSPQRLRPHGHGEANAARGRQLAVLDTLAIARVECGLGIDSRLLGEQEQVAPNDGDVRIREAEEARD